MSIRKSVELFLISALIILLFSGCDSQESEGKELFVVHAGSLSIPFGNLSKEFMKRYPDIKVRLEAYGSRTACRQVSDLGRKVDIVASADSDVIRKLLYPDHANFCIDFTANSMVVAGTKKSKRSMDISSSNWYKVLTGDDVEFGYSDPDSDPCGYRAILTMKLSEKYYRIPGLFNKFMKRTKKKNIRPKEVDLLSLLEAGELDYIFIYRSVAKQHGLMIINLPKEVNLGSSQLSGLYGEVYVDITGKQPGEFIRKKGTPMIYGLTVPITSEFKENAIKFIGFLFSKRGAEIMKRAGQPLIHPVADNPENIPEELRVLLKKNEL